MLGKLIGEVLLQALPYPDLFSFLRSSGNRDDCHESLVLHRLLILLEDYYVVVTF